VVEDSKCEETRKGRYYRRKKKGAGQGELGESLLLFLSITQIRTYKRL
jgi:hypothetical protein